MGTLSATELARAIALAANAHAEQLDKTGKPYILHPIRVMQRCDGYPIEVQIVAVLHDTVEDTHVTLDALRQAGFPPEVIDGVDAMSRREGEDYFSYIKRCSDSPAGCVVKLADLADNSDPRREFKGAAARLERYRRARLIIEAAMRGRGEQLP